MQLRGALDQAERAAIDLLNPGAAAATCRVPGSDRVEARPPEDGPAAGAAGRRPVGTLRAAGDRPREVAGVVETNSSRDRR